MLCARTRSVGSHGCRTRASAGGGRGAAGTGGHHVYDSSNTEVIGSHHIYFLRKGLSSLALVFLLFLVPRYAYAAPSLEVDGNFAGYEDGEEYKGYVVVDSPDNYQSTLCLIGEYGKLVQITTEQYETLSNPSTGGAFYELSQLWRKLGRNASGTDEYYPKWLALSEDFADGLVTVYGYGRVWAAVCTDALKEQAKKDFNTILDGGSVGGGSSDEPVEGTVTVDNGWVVLSGTPGWSDDGGLLGYDLSMHDYIWNDVISEFKKYNYKYMFLAFGGLNGNPYNVNANGNWIMIFTDNKPEYVNGTDYKDGFIYSGRLVGSNQQAYMPVDNAQKRISIPFQVVGVGGNGEYDDVKSNIWPVVTYYFGTPEGLISGGDGGSSEEPSPDPWEPPTPSPDPPTNPTPPSPKDPITTDPPSLPGPPSDPVMPSPPNSPTLPTDTTHTADLQGILDALSEHCIHIQTCLNSNFSGQNSYLGELFSIYTAAIVDQIYNGDVSKIGAIGDVNNTIAQGLSDIFDYWDDYTEWLDKKLDFKIPESDPYDDADLLNWLRKIWARQGTGDVNTRPVDPATNYGGMTRWLGVLYGEITGDVSDTSITALSSSLNALQHTFPFSLPWDIQQILQALDATPATPAASITVPALAGAWDAYSYDIDLHWMDSAMVAVRGFELLAFVLYCLVHTKEVFGYVVGD